MADANVPASELWTYSLQLPHDPRAVRIARTTTRTVLSTYGLHRIVDTAELLTSELVTNAYRHAAGPATVRVRRMANRVRIGVWDSNPVIPALFADGGIDSPDCDLGEQGRGLMLVLRCADNCGGYAIGEELHGVDGKLPWFEILCHPRPQ